MDSDERLVKTEFHLHTAETSPCGMATAADLLRVCAGMGYGGVIVTDHYLPGMVESREARDRFLKGYRAARKAAQSLHITVLPGMEFRFDRGYDDFLIYGMEEDDFAELPDDLCRYTLRDFSAFCHTRGYLIFQAHPFRLGMTAQNPAFLDGVEVFNGNPRQINRNELALAFARMNRLLEIGGGDVRQLGDVRAHGRLVPESMLTPKRLVQFLREHPAIGTDYEESV
jgi:predicted metal-dependent phosphoesterase TrpH